MLRSYSNFIDRHAKLMVILAICFGMSCMLLLTFSTDVAERSTKMGMIFASGISGILFILIAAPVGWMLADGIRVPLPIAVQAEISIYRNLNSLKPGEKINLNILGLQYEDFIQLEQRIRSFDGFNLSLTDLGELYLERSK